MEDKRPVLVYITYMFENLSSFQEGVSFGYTSPVHCNYVQKIFTDDVNNKVVSLTFSKDTIFRFMQNSSGISGAFGYGWNAEKMYAIIQVIETEDENAKPLPDQWRKVEITDQINGFSSFMGSTIPPENIVGSVMSVGMEKYYNSPKYNLNYLNYPLNNDENNLTFGEEVFFFGNVSGEIKATIFEMEINVILPLNEFNTSTNPTWKEGDTVYITEIGIYDDNGVLMGIGKFSIPVDKTPSKHRTLQLKLQF